MGVAALRAVAALLAPLTASAAGECIPWLVESGNGCTRPILSSTACQAVASQHPSVTFSGSLMIQQAPDRPGGCWWQESNGNLWYNTESSGVECTAARKCLCCSPYLTSPFTVTAISTAYVIGGTPTVITLDGTITPGDKVAWAKDCATASPSLSPGSGTALYTLFTDGIFKLCYQARGTDESVEQVGIELEVVTPCEPEPVTGGPSGSCEWPIVTARQCSFRASLHPEIPDDKVAELQDAYDRPFGCWWQPANGGLYFNMPSDGSAPVPCTAAFACMCCKVTTTSTTSTATTVTSTSTTTTTSSTTETTLTITATTSSSTTSLTTTSLTTTSLTTTSLTSTTTTTSVTTSTSVTTTTTTTTTTISTSTTSSSATTSTTTVTSSTTTSSKTSTATSTTSTLTTETTTNTATITSSTSTTTTTTTNTTITTTTSRTTLTSTTTTSTTTTTRSDSFISIDMVVANLDYHGLLAEPSLLSSFEDTIKKVIMFEARNGAMAHMIDLVLSPGSARVAASVYVDEELQQQIYERLAYSDSLQTNLRSSLNDLPGISRVSSGLLDVEVAVFQVASACSLFACPPQYLDKPLKENISCDSGLCSEEQCCDREVAPSPPPSGAGGVDDTSAAGASLAIPLIVAGFAVLALACFLIVVFIRNRRNRLCGSDVLGPKAGVEPEEPDVQAASAVTPVEEGADCGGEALEDAHEDSSTTPNDVAEPRQRTCSKGHALQSYTVPWSGDFSCDKCGEDFPVGSIVWTCPGCHSDLCNSCSGGDDEELPRCPGGHDCGRFALEPGTYTSASCSRCLKADLARSCSHFFRCGACQYDLCPDCAQSSSLGLTSQMQALMQALSLAQEQDQMVAAKLPESVVLQSAEHAAKLDAVDLQLLSEGHDSMEVGLEYAIRTVNATTTELSRIMAEVQVAPTGTKQALLAEAEALQRAEEYQRARRMLESLNPDVVGVDPFGGIHMR